MSSRSCRVLPAIIALCIILILSGCGRERAETTDAKKAPAVTSKKAETKKSEKKNIVKNNNDKPVPGASAPLPIAGGGLGSVADSFLGGNRITTPAAPSAPGVKGAPGRAVAPPKIQPGKRPTSGQLLQVVQAAYRSMKSLKLARVSSDTMIQDGRIVAKQKDIKSSFLFKRPNKFVVSSNEGAMYTDGKSVCQYDSRAKRYIKGKMSDDILARMAMGKPGVSIIGLLLGMDYIPRIKSSKLLADSKIGGKDTFVLSLDLKAPAGAIANHKLWIGKKDYGIYKEEFFMKMTPQAPPGYKGKVPKLMQNRSIATFTEFAPNLTVADSAFSFKPPTGAKQFDPQKQIKQPEPVNLLGKHAPDFSFKWTDGSTKKISDFRGKTVVLDFWALPMAEKHLPVLHSVNKSIKEGVQVISICLTSDEAKTQEYLKGKGFSFPVAMATQDMARVIMTQYRIMGVPTIYIIDKQGVIRRQILGDITESDFMAKIDKVAAM